MSIINPFSPGGSEKTASFLVVHCHSKFTLKLLPSDWCCEHGFWRASCYVPCLQFAAKKFEFSCKWRDCWHSKSVIRVMLRGHFLPVGHVWKSALSYWAPISPIFGPWPRVNKRSFQMRSGRQFCFIRWDFGGTFRKKNKNFCRSMMMCGSVSSHTSSIYAFNVAENAIHFLRI